MRDYKQYLLHYILFFYVVQQALSTGNLTYKAAVVEYYPVQNISLTPDERTNANVDAYIDLIKELDDKKFDILVYPEATIYIGQIETRKNLLAMATIVPEKSEYVVPCNDTNFPEFFRKLSCFAASISTYVVVNLIEKEVCSLNCAPDKWNLYNSDVVFDRNGTVIQRYRKYNLFGEVGLNTTKTAEIAVFETDFGVEFGLFTCFDIMFEEPALQLVRQGVKHIIFPTMWFSQLPFLTALQTQNMFAVENDVVFLASGANSARRGSGGTGIYQGKLGPILYDIIGDNGSKVYVANVLKVWDSDTIVENKVSSDDNVTDKLASAMDGFYLMKENLSQYKNYPMVPADSSRSFVDNTLTCRLSYKLTYENLTVPHYDYVFFYYSGLRSYSGVRSGAIDVCGVVFCQNYSPNNGDYTTCGERYKPYETINWDYVFEELSISANFTVSHSSIQYPNTLLSSIRPMDRSDYEWTSRYYDDGKIVEKTLRILKPQHRLLTFGIYGRNFNKDNAANWNYVNNFLIIGVVVLVGKLVW